MSKNILLSFFLDYSKIGNLQKGPYRPPSCLVHPLICQPTVQANKHYSGYISCHLSQIVKWEKGHAYDKQEQTVAVCFSQYCISMKHDKNDYRWAWRCDITACGITASIDLWDKSRTMEWWINVKHPTRSCNGLEFTRRKSIYDAWKL